MRERELKPATPNPAPCPRCAPHAGARIETFQIPQQFLDKPVAPHAGARIETLDFGGFVGDVQSLPMRERELKR